MTKQQLLDAIKGKPFVLDIESVEEGELVHKNLNIKTYAVNIFEVIDDKVGLGRTVIIYVKDEGTAKEKAFYKNNKIASKLQSGQEAI